MWFKNRRAKFRKGQRCSPLSRDRGLEDMLAGSKSGPEEVRKPEETTPLKDNKTPRPHCPPATPLLGVKYPDLSSDSDTFQCTLKLRSPTDFGFVPGERYSLPPHQPVMGVLSAELNLPPVFWPILQQQGPVVGVHPLSVTKNCSLSLQTAYSSKAAALPHLGL